MITKIWNGIITYKYNGKPFLAGKDIIQTDLFHGMDFTSPKVKYYLMAFI